MSTPAGVADGPNVVNEIVVLRDLEGSTAEYLLAPVQVVWSRRCFSQNLPFSRSSLPSTCTTEFGIFDPPISVEYWIADIPSLSDATNRSGWFALALYRRTDYLKFAFSNNVLACFPVHSIIASRDSIEQVAKPTVLSDIP